MTWLLYIKGRASPILLLLVYGKKDSRFPSVFFLETNPIHFSYGPSGTSASHKNPTSHSPHQPRPRSHTPCSFLLPCSYPYTVHTTKKKEEGGGAKPKTATQTACSPRRMPACVCVSVHERHIDSVRATWRVFCSMWISKKRTTQDALLNTGLGF